MTTTPGTLVYVSDETETATVIGPVLDQDEHMVIVRWNATNRTTHEYPSDLVAA